MPKAQMYLFIQANHLGDTLHPRRWPDGIKHKLSLGRNGDDVYLPRRMRKGQKFRFTVAYERPSTAPGMGFSAMIYEYNNYDMLRHTC